MVMLLVAMNGDGEGVSDNDGVGGDCDDDGGNEW